jgi:hypothetical protein
VQRGLFAAPPELAPMCLRWGLVRVLHVSGFVEVSVCSVRVISTKRILKIKCKDTVISQLIGSFKVANYWVIIFLLIGYLFVFYCQISNK